MKSIRSEFDPEDGAESEAKRVEANQGFDFRSRMTLGLHSWADRSSRRGQIHKYYETHPPSTVDLRGDVQIVLPSQQLTHTANGW